MDLPADGGVLRALRVDAIRAQWTGARAHDAARVVVHAKEIERPVVAIELSAAIEVRPVEAEPVFRVAATEKRIEEPAVEIAVHPHGRLGVGGRVARGIARRQVERVPDAPLPLARAEGGRGRAVRKEEGVAEPDRGLRLA